MKRILFVFTLVLVIFIQSPLLLQYNESELEGFFNDNCSYMDIKSTGDINNVEEFSKAVEDFSEKENAFVATLGYDTQTENKKEITHLYIAGSNVPSFFNRYGLTSKAINNSNENINVTRHCIDDSSFISIFFFLDCITISGKCGKKIIRIFRYKFIKKIIF